MTHLLILAWIDCWLLALASVAIMRRRITLWDLFWTLIVAPVAAPIFLTCLVGDSIANSPSIVLWRKP